MNNQKCIYGGCDTFTPCPDNVLERTDLSGNDKWVFSLIFRHTVMRQIDQKFMKIDWFVKRLGMSRSTILRSLETLIEKNLIEVKRVPYGQVYRTVKALLPQSDNGIQFITEEPDQFQNDTAMCQVETSQCQNDTEVQPAMCQVDMTEVSTWNKAMCQVDTYNNESIHESIKEKSASSARDDFSGASLVTVEPTETNLSVRQKKVGAAVIQFIQANWPLIGDKVLRDYLNAWPDDDDGAMIAILRHYAASKGYSASRFTANYVAQFRDEVLTNYRATVAAVAHAGPEAIAAATSGQPMGISTNGIIGTNEYFYSPKGERRVTVYTDEQVRSVLPIIGEWLKVKPCSIKDARQLGGDDLIRNALEIATKSIIKPATVSSQNVGSVNYRPTPQNATERKTDHFTAVTIDKPERTVTKLFQSEDVPAPPVASSRNFKTELHKLAKELMKKGAKPSAALAKAAMELLVLYPDEAREYIDIRESVKNFVESPANCP